MVGKGALYDVARGGIYSYAPISFRNANRVIETSSKYPNRQVSDHGELREPLC